jgi:hypothetical protein
MTPSKSNAQIQPDWRGIALRSAPMFFAVVGSDSDCPAATVGETQQHKTNNRKPGNGIFRKAAWSSRFISAIVPAAREFHILTYDAVPKLFLIPIEFFFKVE